MLDDLNGIYTVENLAVFIARTKAAKLNNLMKLLAHQQDHREISGANTPLWS